MGKKLKRRNVKIYLIFRILSVLQSLDGQPFHSIASPSMLFLIVFHELQRSTLVTNGSVFYNFIAINISGFYHIEIKSIDLDDKSID